MNLKNGRVEMLLPLKHSIISSKELPKHRVGGGTSLVTNTYTVENVTINANKSATARFQFSSPIALSKVRAVWIRTDAGVVGSLVAFEGNIQADQVYMISYNLAFLPVEADTRTQTTINPTLYITMEE